MQTHRKAPANRQGSLHLPRRAQAPRPAGRAEADESPAKKAGRKVLIFAVILLLICGASFWYWRSTFTEDTDDAQVDGDIYQVSARVTGQVTKVFVEENKPVKKGELLLEIDPTDYQVALDQANANLASAQADYVQANVNVPVTGVNTQTTLANSGVDVQVNTTGVGPGAAAGSRRAGPH